MKRSLLMLSVAFGALLASAQTKVEINRIWYNLDEETKQAEITYKGDNPWDYDEYSGSLLFLRPTISYNDEKYSVTGIGDYAFAFCSNLTSITIPNILAKITSIGSGAFSHCSNLTSITISEGVTSIGDDAFNGCSRLTAITIPESVTSIGDAAFNNCSSLTAIDIPEGVTSIGSGAFYGCSSLTAINIPEGVTSIGSGAFSYCSSLISMTVDENNAYYDSRDGCNGIVETSTNTLVAVCERTIIPASVTSIGEAVFAGCSNLTAFDIPEGVTSIGERAFSDCSNLTAITIPEGVTSIGDYAFIGCTNLTTITIPSSVTSIGWAIFAGCDSLKNVYCYAEKVPSARGFWFIAISEHATLHVPENALEAYKSDASWGHFPSIVALTEEEMGVEQSVIEEQHEIYNLQGHRVTHPTKGIYIVNGKKVVIK